MTLLTVVEAAERLRVCKSTVYNLLQSGDLPAVRIRAAWRISDKDLEDYLERMITGAKEESQRKEAGKT